MKACVVISEKNIEKAIELIHKYELCEIRLDLCQFNDDEIRKIFSQGRNLIATFHGNEDTVSERVETLKLAIESGATYVDIDYYLDLNIFINLIEFAKKHNCISIVSYHNFEETPMDFLFDSIIQNAQSCGSDIVKIATKSNQKDDADRILELYDFHSNIIAFCMGEEAKYTRIESLKRGAPFCYVYDGEDKNKVADGQMSLNEYEEAIKKF